MQILFRRFQTHFTQFTYILFCVMPRKYGGFSRWVDVPVHATNELQIIFHYWVQLTVIYKEQYSAKSFWYG